MHSGGEASAARLLRLHADVGRGNVGARAGTGHLLLLGLDLFGVVDDVGRTASEVLLLLLFRLSLLAS